MSDTHSLSHYFKFDIPHGDILIHAGDFSACGELEEVLTFNRWLGEQDFKHKLVIAGNHELSFDPNFNNFSPSGGSRCKHNSGLLDDIPTLGNTREALKSAVNTQNIRQYLTNCTYLEDSGVKLFGLNFWGTPWQPE